MRDMDEPITITLTRQEWFNVTGALGHDVFDGAFNEQYDKIWAAAFPTPQED